MSERQELAQEILDAIGAKSGDPHDRLRTVLGILEVEGAVVRQPQPTPGEAPTPIERRTDEQTEEGGEGGPALGPDGTEEGAGNINF